MSLELQILDCNCNDCGFMLRDFNKLSEAKEIAYNGNKELFERWKKRKMQEAWDFNNSPTPPEGQVDNRFKKCSNLIKEVRKREFVFSHDSNIHYGQCKKFNKEVTFIPNILQLETQECFIHRKKA